jgi:hypothetical protein
MKKLFILTILATICSALLVFVTCCGWRDGYLSGDPFPFALVNNENLDGLKAQYKLMDQVVEASESTMAAWNDMGAFLSLGSLFLNILLLSAIRRNRTNAAV